MAKFGMDVSEEPRNMIVDAGNFSGRSACKMRSTIQTPKFKRGPAHSCRIRLPKGRMTARRARIVCQEGFVGCRELV